MLSPMGLDPAHPFPNVQNKGLNMVIDLEGRDAFGRDCGLAILPVPRCLPRLIQIPEQLAHAPHQFVMLSSAIHDNVDLIFPNMKVTGCHQFRVTRNSDMWVDEDEADDLLSAIKGELHGGTSAQLFIPRWPTTALKRPFASSASTTTSNSRRSIRSTVPSTSTV